MAEDRTRRADVIAVLKVGLDLGMTLIDTAEMCADGATEELVGTAVAGRRDDVFLVSKVLPHHATRHGTIAACEGSLRLGTDRIELYLLHWPGRVPLQETIAGFEALIEAGGDPALGRQQRRRRRPGGTGRVAGRAGVQVNQVLYTSTGGVSNTTWCRGVRSARCRSWRIRRWSRAAC